MALADRVAAEGIVPVPEVDLDGWTASMEQDPDARRVRYTIPFRGHEQIVRLALDWKSGATQLRCCPVRSSSRFGAETRMWPRFAPRRTACCCPLPSDRRRGVSCWSPTTPGCEVISSAPWRNVETISANGAPCSTISTGMPLLDRSARRPGQSRWPAAPFRSPRGNAGTCPGGARTAFDEQ